MRDTRLLLTSGELIQSRPMQFSEKNTGSLHTSEPGDNSDGQERRGRNKLLEHWFMFKLQQYKVDEEVGPVKARVLLTAYFLISIVSTTDWDGIETRYIRYDVVSHVGLFFRSFVLAVLLANFLLLPIGLFTKSCKTARPSWLIKAYCSTKYFIWYIGHPIMVWSYAPGLTGHKSEILGEGSSSHIYGWVVISLGFVLTFIGCLFRSHLPTKGKLNTPNKLMEPLLYYTQLLTVLCRSFLNKGNVESIFDITTMGLLLLILLICWYEQVFWWASIDRFFLMGQMIVLAVRVAVVSFWLTTASKIAFPYIVFAGLASILSIKLTNNLMDLRATLRVKYISLANERTRFVTILSTKLVNEDQQLFNESNKMHPMVFFQNQIGREKLIKSEFIKDDQLGVLDNLESADRNTQGDSDRRHDSLWTYYITLWYGHSRRPHDLKLLLFLQIIFLEVSILRISYTLNTLKKSLGPEFHRCFDIFLFEEILAARLQTKAKGDNLQSTSSIFLSDLLQDISHEANHGADASSEGDVGPEVQRSFSLNKYNSYARYMRGYGKKNKRINLELASILNFKNKYLTCLAQISRMLGTKIELYSCLFDTSSLKSLFVYQKVSHAYDLALEIDRYLIGMCTSPKVPTYVLASSMSYFLKIRFDVNKSEMLFKQYRAKISRFQALAGLKLQDVSHANFDYNSVTLRIGVALDSTLGIIEDISTNYQEHLGEPVGGDPTKLNVNGLFPGQTAEGHLQMMKGLSNQDIFNTQRGFQLNGFDGFLRPVSFVLKIDASIQSGIHSLALLRFPNHHRVQLLLADDQLRVLSSDKKLQRILAVLGVEGSLVHVAQLSEGLAAQIHLHKFLTQLQSKGLRSSSGKIGQSSGQIRAESSLGVLAEFATPDTNIEEELAKEFAFNRARQRVLDHYVDLVKDGVQHRLNYHQLGLTSSHADLPLVTTLEESWFGEDRFYRIWCSFDFAASEETRRLLTEHEIDDVNSQGVLHVAVGDAMRISRSKGSDTGSKQGKQGGHAQGAPQNSLKSDQFGSKVDYSKGNLKPFASILQTLNAATPFEGLMLEAKNRSSDIEQKEAYDWIIQVCSSLPENPPPKAVWTTTQFAPGTPVTPIIARQIAQDSNGVLEQPIYNFSDAAHEAIVKGPKPMVAAHEQLRKMLKDTATLGFQNTTSLAAEVKPSNIQSADAIAMMVPMETTNIEQIVPSQIVQSKSTNKFEEEPEKETKWSKKSTKEKDRLSREFSYRGNADSTTALVAKESKESTIEEKEVKITKIQLQRGERPQDINRVHPAAKSMTGGVSGSPMTSQDLGLAKTYKTVGASLKSKLTGKSKVFKETRTYAGKEVPKKRTIWNLSHLSRVFQKPEKNLNVLRKKEQVTSTYITTVSRGEAFVSHSQLNLNLISRYIAEYKGIRKLDVAPEDKNHSITASTKSNSSKGAYLFKLVHNALAAKRKGSQVYFFTAGLACLTLFFALAFQVTITGLQSYNRTNQDSFLLVTKFITFERRLIEAVEFQETLYEHSYAAWVPSLWNSYRTGLNSSLPPPMNSSMYLLLQFSGIVDDITTSLQEIMHYSNSLSSRKDAGNINGVVFETQTLNYWERRYQTSRNLSTPYTTWEMPYFSVIAYFAELLTENQLIFRRILERGLITNTTQVPNDPDLLLVQKIKFGFTANVANGILNNLDELFQQTTRGIVSETVDQHFTPVFSLIYACIGISVLMIGLSYYSYRQTNAMHKQHLESFSCLKAWEVAISIEDNEHLENLFTKYAFHEVQLINEYLDLGLYSTVAQFNNRILKLEQKLSKDKDKSGGYKFAHNFSFLSSKLYFVFVALNLVIFAMLYVTVAAFLATNENRIGVQQLMYNAHSRLIKVKKFYLTPFLMLIYGYSVNIGSKSLAQNPYNQTYDEFLQFLTQSRTEYINYFDADELNTIEDISFGDICGRGRDYLKQTLDGVTFDFYPNCVKNNNASATRGIFGFLQYDQNILERVRNFATENYGEWLTNSTRASPTRPQTGLLFFNTLSQQRSGHKTVLNLYYRLLENLTVTNIDKITTRLELVINQILQTVAIGYFLAVLAGYVLFLFLQAREIDRCYEAYKLIDPYFLMSNRYLQHRFKSAFQGHE